MWNTDRIGIRGILLLPLVIFLVAFSASAPALNLNVVNYQLVSKTKAASNSVNGTDNYEYVYRVSLANTGGSVYKVTAEVGSTLREVTIIKGTVNFDLVLAGQTVPSINTFTIQAKGTFDSRLAAATNTATMLTWQIASAIDNKPPVISAQTPANNSIAIIDTPVISALFIDYGSDIAIGNMHILLDGVDVIASATLTVGSISYQPAMPLTQGTHTVALSVADRIGNIKQASWSFVVDSIAPVISALTPINNSYLPSKTPLISAQYADALSGVDATKVQLLLDNVNVSATATITATGMTYQSANLAEGTHQLVLSIFDMAGNPGIAAWQFTVDTFPPAISALTPVNGATLANSTPLVSAQYADANSGIDLSKIILTQDGVDITNSAIITANNLSYQSATTLAQGSHHIGLTVVDNAGNSSQSAWGFLIDSRLTTEAIVPATTPAGVAATAVITIVIPDPNVVKSSVVLQQLDAQGRVTVIGQLHDDGLQGDALAYDQTYTLSFSIYEQNPGNLTYRVAAQIQGQLTPLLSNLLTFTVSGTVGTGITLTQPTDLAFFNTGTIIVTGTISDPAASVLINGIAANISGNTYQASVPLQEGYNPLTAVATNSNGSSATASVQVTLDTTPPKVTVIAPIAGYSTTEPVITVTGIVNDIVVGTVNDQQASVTVNGIPAQVSNRTYTAPDIPLQLGANTLRIVALDRTGNSATQSITVTRIAVSGTIVKMISGNNQTGTIATPVVAPLVVQILNGITPVANVPVIFKVTQNDATLQPGAPQSTIVIVNTDATGLAHANLTLGNRAGAGNNVVEAYSTGATGIAVFTASGLPKAASLISVDSGNNQFGAVNQPLILPLVAVVTDPGFNRLGGIPVTFLSKQGFGTFNGASSFETVTDSDGRAAASLTLGTQPGLDNNVIEAYVTASLATGSLGYPAAFTASGKVPGDPLNTRISGIVQDNSGQPIPAVTMRLYQANLGTHNNEQTEVIPPVITDATGHFTLSAAPVGLFKLMADGKTALSGGKNYPTLEYDIVTVAGQDNTLGMPIYLPALDPLYTLCVDEVTGGTLTLPTAPGFALTIQPGAATFPGGAKSGCVSVTPVNPDKMPMAPGFGQQPRYIVTIQPVGTTFNPPAALTIPNLDGLAPHAKTEMYSYDHDLAAFVAIGSATVSADGSTIASDPGIGVMKAGWHCGGNPNTTGSVGTCPTCKKCSGSGCAADNSQTPPQISPPYCKKQICSGGSVITQDDPAKDGQQCQMDASTTGVCKAGNCVVGRLKVDMPAANTRLDITTAPQMPALTAHASILDLNPDPTPTTNFTWSTQIRYTGPNGRSINFDMPPMSVVGGNYTGSTNSLTRGGDITFNATANVNGNLLSDKTTGIIIRGLNPNHADVNAALGGFPATNIACWESLHRLAQFNSSGLPLFGGPNGYGIMQVDNPPVSDEGVWNWRQNVAEGLAIIDQKRASALGYPNRIKAAYPDATDYVALNLIDATTGQAYVTLDWIQLYNGFHYWVWDDVNKAWVVNPEPNRNATYVTNVLNASCP